MNGCSRNNHKKATHDSYRNVLNRHILPELGSLCLDEIRRKDIKNIIYKKQDGGLSAGSVRLIKAYTGSFLSQAVDDEIIQSNPALIRGNISSVMITKKMSIPFHGKRRRHLRKPYRSISQGISLSFCVPYVQA